MAGSLSHITNEDGSFTFDAIENMGDAYEALEESHRLIAYLLPIAGRALGCDATGMLAEALHSLGLPKSRTPVQYVPKD